MNHPASIRESTAKPPFRHVDFAPPRDDVERRPDGVMVLRSPLRLGDYERNVMVYLRRWAAEAPERVMLAARGTDKDWRRVSFGQIRPSADAIAEAPLNRGLSPDRPLMLLAVLLATLGVQAIALGLVGEMIVHFNASRRRGYRLREPRSAGDAADRS